MSEMAVPATGIRVLCGTSFIGEIADVKIPKRTRNKRDTTSHDNVGGVESSILTSIVQSDGTIRIFYYGSTAQDALETDFQNNAKRQWEIIFPETGPLAGRSYQFTAQIASIDIGTEMKGSVTWDLAITPISALVPRATAATGLTTPFFTVADDDSPANAITPTPAAAGTVHEYNVAVYSDNTNYTVTPTASAGTIYVNSVPVVSGAASGNITAPTASGDVKYTFIVVVEAGKTSKTYLLRVTKSFQAHP